MHKETNRLAIKVENLSKAYQLGDFGTGTLSRDLERWWALKRGKEDPYLKIGETNNRALKGKSDIVWSLKDINFEIAEGDAVGIIGRNGAGKSTLLKVLSRITSPTSGIARVKGRIASLLEVGTGFHPELTGKENIYLNGAIMGMKKREIKRKFDEIIDFAGVERYIDTPVKRYSSGMYVRLAFAVAAYLESEILIVDEVLAVGDFEFQKKCLGKMGDVNKQGGRTVLFVSHNMLAVQSLCKKGIVLNNGYTEFQGDAYSAIKLYLKSLNTSNTNTAFKDSKREGNGFIQFTNAILTDARGHAVTSVESGKDFQLILPYVVNNKDFDYRGLHVSVNIKDHYGTMIYNHTNLLVNKTLDTEVLIKNNKFIVTIKNLPLIHGSYKGGINFYYGFDPFDVIDHAFDLDVVASNALNYQKAPNPVHGIVLIETDWELG
jgi:lipopolysaccharide transport system ATP-binding protein